MKKTENQKLFKIMVEAGFRYQRDLAKAADVPEAFISEIINRPDYFKKLADVLGVSVKDVVETLIE